MKNLIQLSFVLMLNLLYGNLFAQWDDDYNGFIYTPDKVGINTFNIGDQLGVRGDIRILGENPFLRFQAEGGPIDSGHESGLHWKNVSDVTNMRMLYSWLDDRLYILPDTDQNLSHFTVENSSGYVGINLRNPQEQFHVNGKMLITDDIRFDGPEFLQWEEAGVRKAYLTYNGTNLFLANNEVDGNLYLRSKNELNLSTDGISRMMIKDDGKIGINNVNPAERLDINGKLFISDDIRIDGSEHVQWEESGIRKAYLRFTGIDLNIENDEAEGWINIDGKQQVKLLTNDLQRMVIKDDGKIGVGTDSPTELLHVTGGIRIGAAAGTGAGTIRYSGSDFEGRVGTNWVSLTGTSGGGSSVWNTAGGNAYYTGGNVGIGTLNPTHTLQIHGDLGLTGEIVGVSDVRTKKNIEDITDASAIVQELRPVRYEFNETGFSDLDLPDGSQYGFIAQEVQDVLPDVVSISATADLNGTKTHLKGINYIELIPVLTQALKEQQSVSDAQQAQIDAQQIQIKELKKLLEVLVNDDGK